MKKVFLAILCVVLCIGLFSCTISVEPSEPEQTQIEQKQTQIERLVRVYRSKNGLMEIYADSETKVMYLVADVGYGAGLTVMVDADGSPLLWEGELG